MQKDGKQCPRKRWKDETRGGGKIGLVNNYKNGQRMCTGNDGIEGRNSPH